MKRLREQHREDERQHRQRTYYRFLAVLDRFDMYATGYPAATDEQFEASLAEYNSCHGAIHLYGAQPVRDSLSRLVGLFEEVGKAMSQMPPSESKAERFAVAYRPRRREIIDATAAVGTAMRADVTRDILRS